MINNQFVGVFKWTKAQSKIYRSKPNVIVTGCAGSGKTLLACHIAARHSNDKKVAIVVLTKALRTFIQESIRLLTKKNVTVFYEYEWREEGFQQFDIIIVDEFQDFSLNDILTIISSSRNGVYLFGDIEQKLYDTNMRQEQEPTLNIDELIAITNFDNIKLSDNLRISEENKSFIKSICKKHSLPNAAYASCLKPKILPFKKLSHELNWLAEFLLNNKDFKNIAILLKKNDQLISGYPYKKRIRKVKNFGIKEMKDYLQNKDIDVGYKYKNIDKLDFSKEVNINVMTYHSAKGLQFDCVILPFSNYANDNFGKYGAKNMTYVALTRATKQIIITYSGLVGSEFSVSISSKKYEGKILKKTSYDDLNFLQIAAIDFFEKHKESPDLIPRNIKQILENTNYLDCNSVKF